MTDTLQTLQSSVKQLYIAVAERDFEAAVTHGQAVAEALEEVDDETLATRSRRDKTRALAALGSALQSTYNDAEEPFGFQNFGRVVQNTRMLLRRELPEDEYSFDTVFEAIENEE